GATGSGPFGTGGADVDGASVGGAAGSGGGSDDAGGPEASGGGLGDGGPVGTPLLGILDQFTALDVFVCGLNESAFIFCIWILFANPFMQPGNGIAEHPMFFVGESYNTIFLVNGGKVIWSYSMGTGGEIDDVWMLTNGHI